MSIISNVVLCSFTTGELTVQSTSNSIKCSFPNKFNKNIYLNQTSICFDLNGNTCIISKDNPCTIKNTKYVSCIGNYIECSSQTTVCSNENSVFFVNYYQHYSTEYDSRSKSSSNSQFPSSITFILSLLLIIITTLLIS
ncbi:hypothetical protein RB653_008834 [Dictyostelium firmibasis]|uniref:Uncharacterized protein n=1 Tax=Dictyostelium firmibasis TaxID=79012 RepID=A0AAN7Z049_9MYCE